MFYAQTVGKALTPRFPQAAVFSYHLILLLSVLLPVRLSTAQSTPGAALATLNPLNGAVDVIRRYPVGSCQLSLSALDEVGKRYFFKCDDLLYTVSTQTGEVLSTVEGIGGPVFLEYDNEAGVLYALYNLNSSRAGLFTVDPETGARQTVGVLPDIESIVLCNSALDAQQKRFFFVGSPSGSSPYFLYAVSTQTGEVLSAVDWGGSTTFLEYDNEAGALYALGFNGEAEILFTIDPETGRRRAVGEYPDVQWVTLCNSALDAQQKRFFFVGSPSGSSPYFLYAVSTQTGEVLSRTGAPRLVRRLEYDNEAGTLLGFGNISSSAPLPVELIDFTAAVDGGNVALQWSTASETRNAGFEVEHKPKGQHFAPLGFVEGTGDLGTPRSYSYRVETLAPGKHVFRLKQIDTDGTFSYSTEVEVLVKASKPFTLTAAYPNPFTSTATFTLSTDRVQHVRVQVLDLLGREVALLYEGVLPANQSRLLTFDGTGLASGLYLVRAIGDAFVAKQKVTLSK